MDDDAALLSMAREILGGPRKSGRASYQVVVTQCEDCGRGFQHANGELIQLDPAIVEMCHCDAQKIPVAQVRGVTIGTAEVRERIANELERVHAHAGDAGERAHAQAGSAGEYTRAHTGDAGEPARADAGNAGEHARADGVEPSEHASTHVGDADELARGRAQFGRGRGAAAGKMKRRRATQETPPAIRRAVFWRDRGRCIVPGCRNATYVDLHHLDLRSEGGGNDPDNLVVLCAAHHGALHRGRLRIDGNVSTGLRIRHADGTAYGFMRSPLLADASAKAFAGLRNLGFSEKTARASLEQALSTAPASATAETLLRSAVARASC